MLGAMPLTCSGVMSLLLCRSTFAVDSRQQGARKAARGDEVAKQLLVRQAHGSQRTCGSAGATRAVTWVGCAPASSWPAMRDGSTTRPAPLSCCSVGAMAAAVARATGPAAASDRDAPNVSSVSIRSRPAQMVADALSDNIWATRMRS